MSDWGDESLDEWMRTVAAHTGARLNAMEVEPSNAAEKKGNADERANDDRGEVDSGSAAAADGDLKPGAPAQHDEGDARDVIHPVPVFPALTEPVSSEAAPKRGRWEVVTEASRYHLDLDRELLRRVRGTVKPGPGVAFPSKLRDHDREWVRLLRIVQLEVGEPAVFDIESLGGPEVLFTRRSTTFVLSIRQLSDDEPFL